MTPWPFEMERKSAPAKTATSMSLPHLKTAGTAIPIGSQRSVTTAIR
jgi:hypothetical protein